VVIHSFGFLFVSDGIMEKMDVDEVESFSPITSMDMALDRLARLSLVGEHQREACRWMLEKELLPQIPAESRAESRSGVIASVRAKARGGVLADEVGLGKTYMAAGLIASNQVKLTMIVTLTNIQLQWSETLESFANLRCINLPDWFHFVPQYEIDSFETVCVITTYNQVRSRPKWAMNTAWDRIILDEGHYIRNPKTSSFLALKAISSRFKWVLTATPIHNSIRDMITLFDWIGVDTREFTSVKRSRKNSGGSRRRSISSPSAPQVHIDEVMRREEDAMTMDEEGEKKLAAVTNEYVLRRTLMSERTRTPELSLPVITETIDVIPWTDEGGFEARLYESVLNSLSAKVSSKSAHLDHNARRSTTIEVIMRLRQICVSYEIYDRSIRTAFNRMRAEKMDVWDVENDAEDCNSMAEEREDNAFFYSSITDLFGSDLDIEVSEHEIKKRIEIEADTSTKSGIPFKILVDVSSGDEYSGVGGKQRSEGGGCAAAPSHTSTDDPVRDIERLEVGFPRPARSSKLERLCERIKCDLSDEAAASKIIVFTSFIEEMNIIKREMDKMNVETCNLHGGMNLMQRANQIELFMDDNTNVRVLIAQIMCGSTGINLQCANVVYITSPTWNPCTETQAIGRVYRQGQKRDVRVVRLIMKDTIEEKCYSTQLRKKTLIDERLPLCVAPLCVAPLCVATLCVAPLCVAPLCVAPHTTQNQEEEYVTQ